MRKEAYKVLISTALGVAAGLSACEATGVTNFIPDSTSKSPNSTEIDPTQTEIAKITSATFESITNNETKKSIIDSLPVNRPQSNGVEDVFSLKVGDKKFNFVMYELTEDEIANGVTIENSEGIKTVQSVATYTEFEGYDGTKSWVRLIGITSKPENPSIVWFYDPNGFPTEERQIDTSRAVFGYDINSKDNILYQPLITVPTSIAGYDYTQALPVVLSGEVPPSMQVDVMYIKPESLLPKKYTQDEINQMSDEEKFAIAPEIEDIIKSNISTVKNNLIIYRGVDGNAVQVYDLTTGEELTLPEAGIAELDLVDGSKLEVMAFSDKQEVMDFIASDAMWFEIKKTNINPIPLTNKMKQEIMVLRDSISGVVPKNGAGLLPPYPMLEINDIKKYFRLLIYDIGENKVIIIYPSKNNEPVVVFFDDPSLKNDRFNLAPFIVNTWKYNDDN